ncbi:uncharacterized protein BXZ73DRAFT_80807 [Epithele typhae]|uniref:uncharacterized protein n=1 Tax=Epithele typhae TaxID=378194 RepID=UPI0020081083|nr:uncharacterized protein BXZ73DRAFT_80807 [Epithele typhae]KAH9917689.1 hypothetical protein BXZ73DRAFT_80807 [Epithele typhae]
MFAAMCTTADNPGLDCGRRCVAEAAGQPEHDTKVCLAMSLEKQAASWVAYMLWPFGVLAHMDVERSNYWGKTSTPATPSPTEDPVDYRAHLLRKHVSTSCPTLGDPNVLTQKLPEVLLRDRWTCCFTGIVNDGAPDELSRCATEVGDVLATHIFNDAVATFHEASADAQILNEYCQMDGLLQTTLDIKDEPRNSFLLDVRPLAGFDKFKWCLKATETPHSYEICYMPDDQRYRGTRASRRHITFEDHSAEFTGSSVSSVVGSHERGHHATGVDLPSPELLRVHCAIAHVLHLSGTAQLFRELCTSSGEREYKTGAAAHVALTGASFMAHVVEQDPYLVMELRESLAATLDHA